ncbi:MAG: PaaX family transcriptional regulator C-terminal domain-containing protein [Streptosporangiaceae bacterium]
MDHATADDALILAAGSLAAARPDTRGPSARAMLFTVLGEYLRDQGSAAWTNTLVVALGELGFAEAGARRALSRAAAADWLTAQRHGRRIRWSLTPTAVRHFAESAVEAYQRRRQVESWDGKWLVLTTSVPESQRALRHTLRTQLRWAGFGPLGQGVWVSPARRSRHQVVPLLKELGLASSTVSFLGELGPVGSEYEVVHDAWDLGGLSHDYRDFVRQLAHLPEDGTPRDLFVRLTAIVHGWRQFILKDPALPGELLPAGWIGHQARALFYERHDRWFPAAARWLHELDASEPGPA